MALESIGLNRDDIKPQTFKGHKFKQGKTIRCGIVFREGADPFKGARVHFKDRYFICKSTKQEKAICCTQSYQGNVPRWRLGGVLVIYEIAKVKDEATGKLKDKLTGYEIVPWVFGEKVFQQMMTIDQEFSLKDHDINVTCDNEEYQNLIVNGCNSSYWRAKKELEEKILKEADDIFSRMEKSLASDLSLEEIRERLGIDAPGSEDAATNVQLDDVLQGI